MNQQVSVNKDLHGILREKNMTRDDYLGSINDELH